jgi:ribulose-phosphate 3-epimerase
MIIAPSILSCDFLNIEKEIKSFDGIEDLWIHLDIMDAHFVPSLTFGKPVIKNMGNITSHKLDAHLMVTNPDFFIDDLKDIGIHNLTFHWEAATHHDRLIQKAKQLYPSVGISLNPSTAVETIPEYIFKNIDLILVMSVNPGFGGQSFIEGTFDKIRKLKEIKSKNNLKFEIQVDGGVNNKNAKDLSAAGATNLVAGSYIFKSDNYKKQINNLRYK